MSQEDLAQSLRSLQRFAGLNETGVLDAATIKLMGQSRCGVPDVGGSADKARRKRRYVLQGTRWKKKVCKSWNDFGSKLLLWRCAVPEHDDFAVENLAIS